MNVDNDLQTAFTTPPAFEDFFNMDLLAAPSSSRSSSSSPRLPPTPPAAGVDPASFFNFLLDDDMSKPPADGLVLPPTIAAPYDFLSAFSSFAGAVPASASPESATGAPAPAVPLAIDPHLVDAPTPSKALSDIDEDDEHDDFDDEGNDDLVSVEAVKVGGRGKMRKGTVQSGGIEKKSFAKERKTEEPDDWRPSPEEYKKMSSKEKRQLRNKISARNFRVRRKEYITTLEGDIAERDRLIDAIRSELGSTKSENVALREEIDSLKKSLLDGRAGPVLPPPGPLPTIPAAITASAQQSATKSSAHLLTPNTHKDLPTSPRLGPSRAFWGGNPAFGSFTPVHTTLVPEFPAFASAANLAGKAPGPTPTTARHTPSPALQENINPALNFSVDAHQSQHGAGHIPQVAGAHAFDAFADVNPFTLKTLDAYRMQLWGKMAAAHRTGTQHAPGSPHSSGSSSAGSTSGSPPASPPLGGLAGSLRPAFFATSSKHNASPSSAALAGKASLSPMPGSSVAGTSAAHAREAEMVAALAGQTLFRRLGGAFWDAFSGAPERRPGAGASVDADKVRRVLEGKAVVRVVDVDELPRAAQPPVREQVREQVAPPSSPNLRARSCASSVTDLLEESMRTLTISKKSSV